MKKVFAYLIIAAAVITAVALAENCGLDKYPVRFAILGDRTGGHVADIYEQCVAEVERLKPDFVMTVGDQIEGYTLDTNTLNNEWNEYLNITSRLTMPIYYTPGNHDITFDGMLPQYQRYAGKPYYSFNYRNLHFVIFDNSRWEESPAIPQEQMDWLTDDLARSQSAEYTLVFSHKPFWYETIARGKPDTLHALFVRFGVDAVFTGHYHAYFSGLYDGIKYTGVGSSGGSTEPGPTGLMYHYVWVTVNDRSIHIAPIKMNAVLPWDEVTAEENSFVYDLGRNAVKFVTPLEVNSQLAISNGAVTVSLNNPHDDTVLEDTLRWNLAPGWSVSPEVLPVRLEPRDTLMAVFNFSSSDGIYPVPEASLTIPYGKNKTTLIKKPLIIGREAVCVAAAQKPKIDGKLNESFWSEPETVFFNYDGSSMIGDSTWFYFAHDAKYLYLGARCLESRPEEIVANVKERDGAVNGEDCVGYFICPSARDTVYQIYFNPLGTIFDQLLAKDETGGIKGDRKWNGQYDVKTSRKDNYWILEARIPLEALGGIAEPGKKWKINFRRKQRRLDTVADWQVPIDYDPETLGFLLMK